MTVGITESIRFHASIETRVTPGGKGKWMLKLRGGDDYTRALAAWGKLDRKIDRTNDLYHETIELYDGTKLDSVAKLSHHRD